MPNYVKVLDRKILKRIVAEPSFFDNFIDEEGPGEWIKETDYTETYYEKRAKAYPDIGDQLDALWKGGADEAAMKAIIDKVKKDYPKPA